MKTQDGKTMGRGEVFHYESIMNVLQSRSQYCRSRSKYLKMLYECFVSIQGMAGYI